MMGCFTLVLIGLVVWLIVRSQNPQPPKGA